MNFRDFAGWFPPALPRRCANLNPHALSPLCTPLNSVAHSFPSLFIPSSISSPLFSRHRSKLLYLSLRSQFFLVAMSLPCSDQDYRPIKMKDATAPGVEVVRCWCGDPCKVKESTDFSDKLGMKFFMCANYEHDPVPNSPYDKPPSPPPLCMYYRWIDTHMPDWAVRRIRERNRRAWASLDAEERRAQEKAEQERNLKEHWEEQHRFFQELGRKNEEARLRMEEEERQRKEAREAERERKRERARRGKEAEEAGDGKGKYPRWTQ